MGSFLLIVLTIVAFFTLGALTALVYLIVSRNSSRVKRKEYIGEPAEYVPNLNQEVLNSRVGSSVDNQSASDDFIKH